MTRRALKKNKQKENLSFWRIFEWSKKWQDILNIEIKGETGVNVSKHSGGLIKGRGSGWGIIENTIH